MRIIFQFSKLKGVFYFPIDYNQILQGFIYNSLSKHKADFLHNTGFKSGSRTFRLFAFSRLLGKYRLDKREKKLIFYDNISFIFSTPVNYIIEDLASNLMKNIDVRLGSNECALTSITVEKPPKFDKENIIKMISPIVVYSTLQKQDGSKKVYYYNPRERDFSNLISENLRKKYFAFTGKDPNKMKIEIKPYKVNKRNLEIIKFKNFIMNGWMGLYKISGSKTLMKLAYDTGLGSKNSQGFGVFELVNKNDS